MAPFLPQSAAILVLCGILTLSGAPRPATVTNGPPLVVPRAAHTQTLLANGDVLIAAGCIVDGCDEGLTRTSELYRPSTGELSAGPEMHVPRAGHVAVSERDGSVLIFGGWSGPDATDVIERYDPRSGTFQLAGLLLQRRDGFTATRLQDGSILIVGGYQGSLHRLSSAEIYRPTTRTATRVAPLHSLRMSHTASLLADGQVLIAGGSSQRGEALKTAELYDPRARTFTRVGSMQVARHKHAAVTLRSGQVLILGGSDSTEDRAQWTSTEVFDPRTLQFTRGPDMHEGRYKLPEAVSMLPNGDVLVAGSGVQAERYRADTRTFEVVPGRVGQDLSYSVSTLLEGGQVFIAGGYDERIRIQRRSWLYRP